MRERWEIGYLGEGGNFAQIPRRIWLMQKLKRGSFQEVGAQLFPLGEIQSLHSPKSEVSALPPSPLSILLFIYHIMSPFCFIYPCEEGNCSHIGQIPCFPLLPPICFEKYWVFCVWPIRGNFSLQIFYMLSPWICEWMWFFCN